MEREEKAKYTSRITVRYQPAEVSELSKLMGKTTCRKLSEYIRKTSLQKPVTVNYRDQSADDFLEAIILLKNELNAIGNNLNQAVHKLHILDHDPQIKAWAEKYQSFQQIFLYKVEEIKQQMNQIYEQWSQE